LHQEDAFADLADNPSLPLEFVILEAEEEPPYEIARIGEFLHIVGSPNLHNLFVLCEPVLICPLR
jgi:hypothetical protein